MRVEPRATAIAGCHARGARTRCSKTGAPVPEADPQASRTGAPVVQKLAHLLTGSSKPDRPKQQLGIDTLVIRLC